MIVNDPNSIFIESSYVLQVSDCGPLRELFNLVSDNGSQAFSFAVDRLVGDYVEFAKGHDEQFLEIGDGPDSGIGVVRMGRFTDGSEIASHQIDEHSIVRDFEQLFSVDFQHG